MSIAQAVQKYRDRGDKARFLAAKTLSAATGVKLSISEISRRALEAHNAWGPAKGDQRRFDWARIKNAHREPNRLEIAVWSGDRLCALALCLMSSSAVEIRFIEGDRRDDCPLKGRRILAVLECAANYAQGCGRRSLRLQPVNEDLAELYEHVYGFSREDPRVGHRFLGRRCEDEPTAKSGWQPYETSLSRRQNSRRA